MPESRKPEQVRQEISVERAGLAEAVGELRSEMTSVKGRVGSGLKVVAAGLAGSVVVFAGLRRLVRRGRD